MNELRQKWIEALRSREYKQTKRMLHKDDKYCCLGVLCSVLSYDKEGPGYKIDGQRYDCFLPRVVLDKVDVSRDEQLRLIYANDSWANFNQIADILEGKDIGDVYS